MPRRMSTITLTLGCTTEFFKRASGLAISAGNHSLFVVPKFELGAFRAPKCWFGSSSQGGCPGLTSRSAIGAGLSRMIYRLLYISGQNYPGKVPSRRFVSCVGDSLRPVRPLQCDKARVTVGPPRKTRRMRVGPLVIRLRKL